MSLLEKFFSEMKRELLRTSLTANPFVRENRCA